MTHTVDNGKHFIGKPSTGYKDKMAKMVELEAIHGPNSVDSLTKADLAPSSHWMSNLLAKRPMLSFQYGPFHQEAQPSLLY